MKSGHPLARGLGWLSNLVYRQADRVVVLGPYMEDRVLIKGVRPERVATIPVWSRRDQVYPVEPDFNPLRKSLGLDRTFVAMYSGNLGLSHSFDEFLEAARRLRDRDDMTFVFVGAGPRAHEVRSARERESLTNVRLLDYVPREELHLSLSAADVHLLSMRPQMTGIVVPSKLYGIMAAGRPALFVGPAHCESADTIRRAGCGFTVAPGDTEGVVRALTTLAGDRDLGHQMGQKGRIHFLALHERNLCCYQWRELLRNTVTRSKKEVPALEAPSSAKLMSPPAALQPAAR
jgi:glycosyltransferase involved in cell wall biosynthesis